MRAVICLLAVVALCSTPWAKPAARPIKAEDRTHRGHSLDSLDCSAAIPVRIGDFLSSDNTGANSDVDYYSCQGWYESGGEVVFELTIDESGPRSVAISVGHDDNGCDLDLFVLGSCDADDCLDFSSAYGVFDLSGPGTYYIVVDGYNGTECPFTLTIVDTSPPEDCCPLLSVCQEFDFGPSAQNVAMTSCGGSPVWGWGTSGYDPPLDCDSLAITNVLKTGSGGVTPDNAGEIAVLGPVSITPECSCMELCHYYNMEDSYDGGNVKVSTDGGTTWQLVVPASFYDAQDEFLDLATSCIPGELAYSSEDQPFEFRTDCFDLSRFSGHDVLVGFFFGSDGSVGYPGWYINSVRFGSSGSPVERMSWGTIKALYR